MPIDVVVASDLLVAAASRVDPDAVRFPVMPPGTGHVPTDVLGTFLYPGDSHFVLILSDEILEQTALVLGDTQSGLSWGIDERDQYQSELLSLAARNGGGLVDAIPVGLQLPPTVGDAAAAAMRCAASPDLGQPRTVAVVTGDESALAEENWEPNGIPWPKNQPITIYSAARFRDAVDRTRRKLRPQE
jgi:hypothetical protein